MAKHTQTIRQQIAIISIILLSIVQFKSPIIILFPFPSFLFCIIFQSFKKAPSPQASCSLVLYPEGALTENSIIRGSNLPFGSVSTSVIPSRPRWSRKNIPFVWLPPGEKKMGPNQLFLVWYVWSWLIWVSVKILMISFGFCKIQVPDPA